MLPSSSSSANPSPSRPPAQPSPLRYSSTPYTEDHPSTAQQKTTTTTTSKRTYDESNLAPRLPSPSPPPAAAPAASASASKRVRTTKKAPVLPDPDEDYEDGVPGGDGFRSSRPLGTTSLPIARVSKIMKADKDLNGSAKEAVFLIAVATEEFIKRLAYEGYQQAKREGRTTVQQKDLATVTKRFDEFNFLSEMIPFPISPREALKRAEKRKADETAAGGGTSTGKAEDGPLAKAFQAKASGASKSSSKKKGKEAAAASNTANGAATAASTATASASTTPDGVSALSNDVSEMDVS